jgi:hypothetical protein
VILLIVVFTMSASEPVLGPIYLIFLQDKFATNITHLAGAFLPAGLVTAFLASRLGALSDSHSRFKMIALVGRGRSGLACPGRDAHYPLAGPPFHLFRLATLGSTSIPTASGSRSMYHHEL